MDMTKIIQQMIILFIVMMVGYMAYKKKVFNAEGAKVLTKLVIYIANPALILNSVMNGKIPGTRLENFYIILVAFAYFMVLPLLAKGIVILCSNVFKKRNVFEAMLTFSNLGFMGIPVINAIYGAQAIFYISIFMIPFTILVFTYGILLLSEQEEKKMEWKKIISPVVIASILALAIYFLQIPTPTIMNETISMLGSVTTPVAMVVLGVTLAQIPLKEVFLDYRQYVFAGVKLLILPVIVYGLCHPFISNKLLLGVMVIVSGMPVATNVALICTEYGGDSKEVAKGTFITTVLSIVTIPILAATIL